MKTAVPGASTAGVSTTLPLEKPWSTTAVALRNCTGVKLFTMSGISSAVAPSTPAHTLALAGSASSALINAAASHAGCAGSAANRPGVSPERVPLASAIGATAGLSTPTGAVNGTGPA